MSATADVITVVSGLPRSGTSLLMRMLEAGGIAPMTDGIRTADDDNPRGYYELEAVKQTDRDPSWLDGAPGKAVKVISQLLPDLPSQHRYRTIFVRRNLDEILASQRKMLANRGEPIPEDDEALKITLAGHVAKIEKWLREADHVEALFVSYNRILADPTSQAERIASFLEQRVDARAMAEVVEPALYRNRR
jgi:hypothetical protein